MRMFQQMKGWSLVLLVLLAGQCAAQQPAAFRPGALWPDNNGVPINAHGGGILFHNNTYYWFGEHKIAGTAGNKAYVGVHCYSSADLYHWKDEGIALAVDSTPGSLIPPGAIIERPKVIYNKKNKQFVLWFHLELKGQKYNAALSGVAVSNNITGPYRFHHAERPNKGQLPVGYIRDAKGGDSLLLRDQAGGQMARDMNLFVDDDEKAYLVYTAEENRTVHISLLSADYLTTAPQYARISPHRFMEASAIFKSRGKYYFVASGCTGWAPNAARSAVADQIFGPWKELGNPCQGKKAGTTFGGQSTYVLPVAGKKDAFIFMADEWRPDNAIDGRYLWLPIEFTGEGFAIPWRDQWSLDQFNKAASH
jgi:hypothetical protein